MAEKAKHFHRKVRSLFGSPMLRRLMALMLVVGLLPSLLVFAMTYSIGAGIIQNNARKDAYGVLQTAQYNVDQTIDAVENVVLALAINDEFISHLRHSDLRVGSLARSETRTILDNTVNMNRPFLSMVCVETRQEVVYTSLFNSSLTPGALELYNSDYEDTILSRNGALYWFGVNEQGDKTTDTGIFREDIRCVSALFDFAPPYDVGLLSLFVKTSAFEEDITHLNGMAAEQFVLLLDQNRQVIASSKKISESFAREISRQEKLLEQSRLVLEGIPYTATALQDRTSGWYLISLQPTQSILEPMFSRTGWMLVPLIFLPLLCLLTVLIFSRQLSMSIRPLMVALNRIKEGDLTVRSPRIQDNVLDLVVDSLNETLDKYNEIVAINSHQEAMLTVSRLKILRGQLSPHFLYNTLDSVNWMLIENGQLEMSRIITDLGALLRYSINESSETVPLSEELDIIRRYLSICQNRFESRLAWSITAEEGLEDYPLPRFLLQPVVENALTHGIEKCPQGGHIHLRCYREEDTVRIDIINDGPSIPREKKEALYASFAADVHELGSEHIGLANVQKRIVHYAGPDFGLELLDAEPQGVLVRLRLPGEDHPAVNPAPPALKER